MLLTILLHGGAFMGAVNTSGGAKIQSIQIEQKAGVDTSVKRIKVEKDGRTYTIRYNTSLSPEELKTNVAFHARIDEMVKQHSAITDSYAGSKGGKKISLINKPNEQTRVIVKYTKEVQKQDGRTILAGDTKEYTLAKRKAEIDGRLTPGGLDPAAGKGKHYKEKLEVINRLLGQTINPSPHPNTLLLQPSPSDAQHQEFLNYQSRGHFISPDQAADINFLRANFPSLENLAFFQDQNGIHAIRFDKDTGIPHVQTLELGGNDSIAKQVQDNLDEIKRQKAATQPPAPPPGTIPLQQQPQPQLQPQLQPQPLDLQPTFVPAQGPNYCIDFGRACSALLKNNESTRGVNDHNEFRAKLGSQPYTFDHKFYEENGQVSVLLRVNNMLVKHTFPPNKDTLAPPISMQVDTEVSRMRRNIENNRPPSALNFEEVISQPQVNIQPPSQPVVKKSGDYLTNIREIKESTGNQALMAAKFQLFPADPDITKPFPPLPTESLDMQSFANPATKVEDCAYWREGNKLTVLYGMRANNNYVKKEILLDQNKQYTDTELKQLVKDNLNTLKAPPLPPRPPRTTTRTPPTPNFQMQPSDALPLPPLNLGDQPMSNADIVPPGPPPFTQAGANLSGGNAPNLTAGDQPTIAVPRGPPPTNQPVAINISKVQGNNDDEARSNALAKLFTPDPLKLFISQTPITLDQFRNKEVKESAYWQSGNDLHVVFGVAGSDEYFETTIGGIKMGDNPEALINAKLNELKTPVQTTPPFPPPNQAKNPFIEQPAFNPSGVPPTGVQPTNIVPPGPPTSNPAGVKTFDQPTFDPFAGGGAVPGQLSNDTTVKKKTVELNPQATPTTGTATSVGTPGARPGDPTFLQAFAPNAGRTAAAPTMRETPAATGGPAPTTQTAVKQPERSTDPYVKELNKLNKIVGANYTSANAKQDLEKPEIPLDAYTFARSSKDPNSFYLCVKTIYGFKRDKIKYNVSGLHIGGDPSKTLDELVKKEGLNPENELNKIKERQQAGDSTQRTEKKQPSAAPVSSGNASKPADRAKGDTTTARADAGTPTGKAAAKEAGAASPQPVAKDKPTASAQTADSTVTKGEVKKQPEAVTPQAQPATASFSYEDIRNGLKDIVGGEAEKKIKGESPGTVLLAKAEVGSPDPNIYIYAKDARGDVKNAIPIKQQGLQVKCELLGDQTFDSVVSLLKALQDKYTASPKTSPTTSPVGSPTPGRANDIGDEIKKDQRFTTSLDDAKVKLGLDINTRVMATTNSDFFIRDAKLKSLDPKNCAIMFDGFETIILAKIGNECYSVAVDSTSGQKADELIQNGINQIKEAATKTNEKIKAEREGFAEKLGTNYTKSKEDALKKLGIDTSKTEDEDKDVSVQEVAVDVDYLQKLIQSGESTPDGKSQIRVTKNDFAVWPSEDDPTIMNVAYRAGQYYAIGTISLSRTKPENNLSTILTAADKMIKMKAEPLPDELLQGIFGKHFIKESELSDQIKKEYNNKYNHHPDAFIMISGKDGRNSMGIADFKSVVKGPINEDSYRIFKDQKDPTKLKLALFSDENYITLDFTLKRGENPEAKVKARIAEFNAPSGGAAPSPASPNTNSTAQ